MNTDKKNPNRLNVRDIITMAVSYVLIFAIYFLGSPIGFNPNTYIFIWAICSILWGTIFLLMYTKVNKNNVPLIFGIAVGLFMLSYHWIVSAAIILGGIIAEIIWRKFDKKSVKTMGIVFTVQILFWQIGATLPIMFMLDKIKNKSPEYGELFNSVNQATTPLMEILALALVVVCCAIGVWIGKKILRKHFEKAGII